MNKRSIFVVVPAYNEASKIAEHLAPLLSAGYTVVVIDDGSHDCTRSVVEPMPVVLLHHAVNLGQGAALQTGMDYALCCGAEIVVHFDADGQHDPAEIPELVAPILEGRADVVLGSRFLRPADAAEVPLAKRVTLRAGILVSGLFTGVWLTDTHNGFRALSRTALQRIRLQESGFAHATEILAQIRHTKLRYIEVPATVRYTRYAVSKGQPLSNALLIVIDLILRRILR